MSQLELLQKNLNDYIAKRYVNDLLKGAIVSGTVLLSAWLFIALLEYLFNFSSPFRTILFFTYLAFAGSVLFLQVLLPLLRLTGLLKSIDEHQAAKSIGSALNHIDDRLANTLSLRNQLAGHENKLALASLDQRAEYLNKTSFAESINFKSSWRLLRYFALPVLVFAVLSISFPDVVIESANRVVNFNQDFTPPAPFEFVLVNESMEVAEGDNFSVNIRTDGSQTPDQVFINTPQGKLRMQKTEEGTFKHEFSRMTTSTPFRLSAAGVESGEFMINVLPVPKIVRNRAVITYPSYTKLSSNEVLNRTQIQVPEGSSIEWYLETKNSNTTSLVENSALFNISDNTDNSLIKKTIGKSLSFEVVTKNDFGLTDTALISVQAIPDEFPSIRVRESFDSSNVGLKYFSGSIADDYGFSRLTYRIDKLTENGRVKIHSENIDISNANNEQSFQFIHSLDSIKVNPNEKVEYYFEVWDNDGVNGSKSAKSNVWGFKMPSEQELKEQNRAQADASKNAMNAQMKELDKLNKELEAFKRELLQKKKTDWQDKEKLKSMIEKQKQMMEKLMKKALDQRQQNELNNRFQEYSPELLEKQQTIQEMFENLFDEEFKKKYEEYNEMLEKLNKDQALDQIDEMTLDNEQLEKELGRTLELFKELEFDQKLEENIKKTRELSEKQKDLKEKTENKKGDLDQLEEEQKKLSKEMEDLEKEMDALNDLNESLEDRKNLPDTKKESENAKEKMNESSQQMQKNNRKKSSESQQDAQESLEEMEEKLSDFQEQQSQEQASENLEDMRQILENLIDLSHNQEAVMGELKTTKLRDPKYVDLAKQQKDILDDTKVVEDSLLALSKRVPEISRQINDEISMVKQSMTKALESMTDQQPNQEKRYLEMSLVNQQLSMTSLNNLAVMFDAMIEQAQKAQNSKMKGNGQCNKPGNGKSGSPSISDMKQMQKGLNEQIQKLKEALEKGKSPDGKKPGQMPGSQGGQMSQELARMAAQQEAIRQQLRQLSNQIESEGGTPGSSLKKLEKMMEQTEEDLLYQDITQKTIERQQKIMTKLLESERAEREREQDEKRQSKSSDKLFETPDQIWEEYQQKKEQELELYKTLPPNLKPYYRNRVNRYFSQFTFD